MILWKWCDLFNRGEFFMYTYYGNRASEYEAVYNREDPVRQAEQKMLEQKLKEICNRRKVLEVACGTGYWTKYVAGVATYNSDRLF